MRRFISSWFLWLIYLAIGVVVAASEDYLDLPWKRMLSAVLAILLWPLTLVGIDLTIK
jgi:hypothetical protein